MSILILPGRFKSQPQQPAPVDPEKSRGLISHGGPWYPGDLFRQKQAAVPGIVTTPQGRAYDVTSVNTINFSSPNQLSIAAGADITCIVAIGKATLSGANPGLWRSGLNSDGTTWCIVQGASRRPWVRVNGTDVLKPASGPQITLDSHLVIGYRLASGVSADVWWGGAQQHSASHAISTPAVDIHRIGSQWYYLEGFHIAEPVGSILGWWIFKRSLADAEMREYTRNPWQILKAPTRRLWSVPGASGSELTPDVAIATSESSTPSFQGTNTLASVVAEATSGSDIPSVVPGSVGLAPVTTDAQSGAETPSLSAAAANLQPDVVFATSEVSVPVTQNGVLLETDEVSSSGVAPVPSMTPSAVEVAPDASVASSSASSPSLAGGGVNITQDPADASSVASTPSMSSGTLLESVAAEADSIAGDPSLSAGSSPLVPDAAEGSSVASTPSLSIQSILTSDPAITTSTAEDVTLVNNGSGRSAIRRFAVAAENRLFTIPAESRSYTVPV